jgi:hypothetical protein
MKVVKEHCGGITQVGGQPGCSLKTPRVFYFEFEDYIYIYIYPIFGLL